MFRSFQSAVVVLSAAALTSISSEPKLVWTDISVEARNIPALTDTNLTLQQWQRLLTVRADQGNLISDLTLPPMAGTYIVRDQTLRFQPQFPLAPNITYRAIYRPPNGKPITATHRIDAPAPKSTTTVSAIYPSASTLPENLLKFYIHFTAPMSAGHIYDYIHLHNSNGKPVELPFLEIDEELWNPDMTRLTLFLDPGRIKRGVKPLEEIGPSFEAGKTYTLAISPEWLDANGAPLKSKFEKKFTVTGPDRDPPDPSKWKLNPPNSKREALTITFNEPLDHAIIERTLRVTDSKGAHVAGKNEVKDGERSWTFTPHEPWKTGEFVAIIPTRIEDLAGNNIGKPFDVDLAIEERQLTIEKVRLPFRAP